MSELWTVAETCARTRLKPATIRDWANKRRIACVRLGSRMLIPASEVERVLADGYRPAITEPAVE